MVDPTIGVTFLIFMYKCDGRILVTPEFYVHFMFMYIIYY